MSIVAQGSDDFFEDLSWVPEGKCHCCALKRRDADLPLRDLIILGKTQNKQLDIYACEVCDGEEKVEV